MDEKVGLKELYDVNIRVNNSITAGSRCYDINETILSFDKAEIAQLQEKKDTKIARGGYHNPALIYWDIDEEVEFSISHGVLSPTSWMLLSNSKINEPDIQSVPFKETVDVIEDDDFWFIELKYEPNHVDKIGIQGNPENLSLPMGRKPYLPLKPLPPKRDKFLFCYDAETGKKILNFEVFQNKIYFKGEHRKIIADYTFDYDEGIRILSVGDRLLSGFLSLTGKMTTKDYYTGQTKTAILEIPKMKITSNIAMKLGMSYDNSIVSDFYFTGYPENGNEVCKIMFLDTELTGDYL